MSSFQDAVHAKMKSSVSESDREKFQRQWIADEVPKTADAIRQCILNAATKLDEEPFHPPYKAYLCCEGVLDSGVPGAYFVNGIDTNESGSRDQLHPFFNGNSDSDYWESSMYLSKVGEAFIAELKNTLSPDGIIVGNICFYMVNPESSDHTYPQGYSWSVFVLYDEYNKMPDIKKGPFSLPVKRIHRKGFLLDGYVYYSGDKEVFACGTEFWTPRPCICIPIQYKW